MAQTPHPTDFLAGSPPGVDRRTLQRARRKAARRSRRRWPRRLLVTLIVVVVLAAGAVGGAYVYVGYRFNQIKKVHAPHLVAQAPPGKPFNILLVGSDTRSFVKNSQQAKAFGGATTVSGSRSDVTIVARVIPATKQIWMLSIPRDLWVNIPGHSIYAGMNRINAAFNTGPDLLIQTIEQDLDIPINHYMAVNFTGFQSMVNALGGITMDFPTPVKDAYSGLNVSQTGCQLVNGATALELVRARHLYYMKNGQWLYDGLSDFSRIQRQDAFFRAVLHKVNSVKFNPFTINSFIGATVGNLTIDDTLTQGELFSLAQQFHGLPATALHTETLPTYGFTTTGGADVLGEAQPYASDMIAAFDLLGTTPATSSTTSTTAAPAAHHHGSSTTTTTAPLLPTTQVRVDVLNAVDFTKPIASTTATELRRAGFTVTGVANAPSSGLTTTTIQYAPGHQEAARTLAAHLEGATTSAVDSSLQGTDVILTVGSSLTGVTGQTPAGTAGTGGGSATTTTTVPPPPGNVYTNTQPEPWNPTPCTL